jgi:ABC-type uncharacterized transport system permease subunit
MRPRVSVSEITILFLYLVTATAFALSRMPGNAKRQGMLVGVAFVCCVGAVALHVRLLADAVFPGITMSLGSALSLVGLLLAAIALLAAIESSLRGMSGGLLILAGMMALASNGGGDGAAVSWQIRAHVLTSIVAYGLLTAGAIVAAFALVQDRRLHSRRLSAINHLFAPLETTEKLLYAVTAAGFTVLALSVVSGITFVENLFAQHLVHKTSLSLLALVVFGVLLAGRHFAGWRGRRAVYLYLAGFALLSLAYFGSRYILEEVLGRSWG